MSFVKFEQEMKNENSYSHFGPRYFFLIRPLPSQKEQGGVFAFFRAAEKFG